MTTTQAHWCTGELKNLGTVEDESFVQHGGSLGQCDEFGSGPAWPLPYIRQP